MNEKQLKKQLLETKNLLVELEEQTQSQEKEIIQLKNELFNHQDFKEKFETTKLQFQSELEMEKETIKNNFIQQFREQENVIFSLKNQLDTQGLHNKQLQTEILSKEKTIQDLQEKIKNFFEGNDHEGVQLIDILEKEQREKEILHKNILKLTQDINNQRQIIDSLTVENKKMRNFYNVPDDFGQNFDDLNKKDLPSQNTDAQLKYLKNEVEELEEEVASLKCKLRQMSALVNNGSSSLFHELNDEQAHMLQMYALSMKQGDYQIPVTDKTKECQKQIIQLQAQIELYEKRIQNQDNNLVNTIKEMQKEQISKKSLKFVLQGEEMTKPLGRENSIDVNVIQNSSQNLPEIQQVWEILSNNKALETNKNKIVQMIIHLEKQSRLMQHYKDKYEEVHQKLQQQSKNENEDLQRVDLTRNKENEFERKLMELSQKNIFLETQLKKYETYLKEQETKGKENEMFIQNAILAKDNYSLTNKCELMSLTLKQLTKKNQNLSLCISQHKSMIAQNQANQNAQIDLLLENLEKKNLQLLNSVSYDEHLKMQCEFHFLRDELSSLKIEHLENQQMINQITILNSSLNKSLQENYELKTLQTQQMLEIRMLNKILISYDEEYEYFIGLIQGLSKKLKKSLDEDLHQKVEKLAQNQGNVLDDQNLINLYLSQGIELSKNDVGLIKKYLLHNQTDKISVFDILNKISIYQGELQGRFKEQATAFIMEVIESMSVSPTDLFKMMDSKNIGKITKEQFQNTLEGLDVKIPKEILKAFFKQFFYMNDKSMSLGEFLSLNSRFSSKQLKSNFIFKGQLEWQNKLSMAILEFLEENKKKFPNINYFFQFLDKDMNGHLTVKDVSNFFIKKLKLDVDKNFVEKYFNSIEKVVPEQLTYKEFEQHLNFSKQIFQLNSRLECKFDMNAANVQELALETSQDKIDFLLTNIKTLEFKMSLQEQSIKESNQQIEFFKQKALSYEQDLNQSKKSIMKLKSEFLKQNSSASNKKLQNWLNQDHSTPEENSEKFEMEKSINRSLLEENENLKIQLAQQQEDNQSLLELKLSQSLQSSEDCGKMQMMIELLNQKHETREAKQLIKSLEKSNQEVKGQNTILRNSQFEMKFRKFQLQNFLIEKVNILQQQFNDLNISQVVSFDIEKINYIEKIMKIQASQIVKESEERMFLEKGYFDMKSEYESSNKELQLLQKLNSLEAKRDPNTLHYELNQILVQNNELQNDLIKERNRLCLEKSRSECLDNKIKYTEIMVQNLEAEIKKALTHSQNREMYWTNKVKDFLQMNNQEEKLQLNEEKENSPENTTQKAQSSQQEHHSSSNIQLERSKQEIKRLSKEIDQLKSKKSLEEINSELDKNKFLSELERKQRTNIESYKMSLKALKTILTEKDLEIDHLKEELETSRLKAKEMNSKITELELLMESMKLKKTLSNGQPGNLQEKIKSKVDNIMNERKHDDYQIYLDSYKQRTSILEKEVQDLAEMNLQLTNQLELINGKYQNILQMYEGVHSGQIEARLLSEQKKSSQLEREKKKLESFLQQLNEKQSLQQGLLQQLSLEKKSTIVDQTSMKNRYVAKINELQSSKSILKQKLNHSMEELGKTQEELKTLQEKYQALNNKMITTNMDLIKKKEAIHKLKKTQKANINLAFKEEVMAMDCNAPAKQIPKVESNPKEEEIQKNQLGSEDEAIPVKPLAETEQEIRDPQSNYFTQIEVKGRRKRFFSFEEFLICLKNILLNEKKRLVFVSKQIQSIFKDRDFQKAPEKILDVFHKFGLILDIKTQKHFIQWFLKYNKFDFFMNFYNNIMILDEVQTSSQVSEEEEAKKIQQHEREKEKKKRPAEVRLFDEEVYQIQIEKITNELHQKNQIIEILTTKLKETQNFAEKLNSLEDLENCDDFKTYMKNSQKCDEFVVQKFQLLLSHKEKFQALQIQVYRVELGKAKAELNQFYGKYQLLKNTKGNMFQLHDAYIKKQDRDIKQLNQLFKNLNDKFQLYQEELRRIEKKFAF